MKECVWGSVQACVCIFCIACACVSVCRCVCKHACTFMYVIGCNAAIMHACLQTSLLMNLTMKDLNNKVEESVKGITDTLPASLKKYKILRVQQNV